MQKKARILTSLAFVAILILPAFAGTLPGGQTKMGPPKYQGSSNVWTTDHEITRPKPPKSSGPRKKPPVIKAPLLTVQWRLLKRGADGSPVEANPMTVFYTGDRLQLEIKTNQNGYLYIIQSTDNGDGTLIYPDSRIADATNRVTRDAVISLPNDCAKDYLDSKGLCWWQMAPPVGREIFTVVYSREMNIDLPQKVTKDGIVIAKQDIDNLLKRSGQKVQTSKPQLPPEQGGGAGRFITWVYNSNRNDNEELIFNIEVAHQDMPER